MGKMRKYLSLIIKLIILVIMILVIVYAIILSLKLYNESEGERLSSYERAKFSKELKDDPVFIKGIESLNEGRYLKAVTFFEKSLLSNVEFFDQIMHLVVFSFGSAAVDIDKGIDYFKNMTIVNSKDYDSLYYMCILMIMRDRSSEDISKNLEKIIKFKTESEIDSPKFHYMLGLAYLFQGKGILFFEKTRCWFSKEAKNSL
jgi:tetratricopeptide (TPR) repeat protein